MVKNREKSSERCVVCCNKSSLYSYFRFPKNPTTKRKWLSFFDFKDEDINPCSRVCSRHFTEDDFTTVTKEGSTKRYLKRSKNINPCPSMFPKKVKLTRKNQRTPCLFCGKNDGEGDRCYFNFPLHNEVICQKWESFCGISREEILPSYRLCSDHFRPQDIEGSTAFNRKRRLVADAVPMIRDGCFFDSNGAIEIKMEVIENTQPIAPTSPQNNRNHDSLLVSEASTDQVSPNTPSTFACIPDIPKRLGDVNTSHFESPRRAEAIFSKAMDVIARKNKIIKVQQQKIKRLQAQINHYKDLVTDLEVKNLVLEDAQSE